MIPISLARRVERIEALKAELSAEAATQLHAIPCDVTREEDILAAYRQIAEVLMCRLISLATRDTPYVYCSQTIRKICSI
ncbi:farnesol dehydrogenase-like [Anopheles stephensi]|uniref:farnesol dehydrogenase-like n=1 Tax=Anopheles stephensi TaxID=30069 RepID=UPI001658B58C|nr:farnesol dehydrogenase-like [Anopheles stephensi]